MSRDIKILENLIKRNIKLKEKNKKLEQRLENIKLQMQFIKELLEEG